MNKSKKISIFNVDTIFDIVNHAILILIVISILYPLYFIVIASISNPVMVSSGQVLFWPRGINFEGYKAIFKDRIIVSGYKNSLVYMVLGTSINMIVTIPAAYSLSRKDLVGKDAIMFIFAFTMFFSGGLIPTYLIVRNLGMINSIWAMVIPNAMSVYNLIISRTFFRTNIPYELLEASQIEGCSNIRFFVTIALPLSKALLAVIALFYGVSHWNAFFNAMIYLNKEELYPIQLVLRNILLENQARQEMMKDLVENLSTAEQRAELIKYGMIIVASVPVLMMYPFAQKFFIKGVMIGAIKG
ncbi:MAG TPA: carbohydrate ABC transporter permease [Clostridiaceae bacterium]|nr:carbohydrate ABC transporter permease [Clostridiaceae bacterium]